MRGPAATYQVHRRLAAGGMAELFVVSAARGGRSGRRWVLKQILPHLARDPFCAALFTAEGELGLRLHHPNVVTTIAVGSGAEIVGLSAARRRQALPFILLEYLDGLDLSCLLRAHGRRGERLEIEEVFALGLGLGRGLAHVHAGGVATGGRGIVHRDVTPSNVMLTRRGEVKVIDFGVASLGPQESEASDCIKGKLAYMAPEQVVGGQVDGRADQFSMALVLWESLAGEPCFPTGDHFDTLPRVARGETRPIQDLRADVPRGLAVALRRALAPAPAARFASVGDFTRALEAAAGEVGARPRWNLGGIARAMKGGEASAAAERWPRPHTLVLDVGPQLRAVGGPSGGGAAADVPAADLDRWVGAGRPFLACRP